MKIEHSKTPNQINKPARLGSEQKQPNERQEADKDGSQSSTFRKQVSIVNLPQITWINFWINVTKIRISTIENDQAAPFGNARACGFVKSIDGSRVFSLR